MKQLLTLMIALGVFYATGICQPTYQVQKKFPIASNGGWDYLTVHLNKLYVSHGMQVNILDKTTGDSIGYIPNTTGVHGIAFNDDLGKGYVSNGRLNTVTVFSPSDDKEILQIPTGQNPDAIMYDPYSKKIITCNGRSNDITVIDPATNSVVATIAVGGKPETAVSDSKGKWFVNIEDKNEIVAINSKTFAVEAHWSIAPCEAPTGLSYDPATQLLFAGCEKLLAVVDVVNGKILQTLPIGDRCDGVAIDLQKRLVFTSNGEGTMTVVKIGNDRKCSVVENVTTMRSARTITIDPISHWLYTPAAEFEPLPADAKQGTRPTMKAGSFQVLVAVPTK